MWGGLVSAIPAGWALCDGQGGRPDLRDRFIRGATGDPGATGGSATHTHADHAGVVTHTHTVAVTDPGHVHVQGVNSASTGGLSGYTADTSTNTRVNSGYSTSSATTGVTAAADAPAGAVAALAHDSPSNLPPFYALAFIVKV
jgi:microcystin-dependent protein